MYKYSEKKPDVQGWYWYCYTAKDNMAVEMIVEVYKQLDGLFADIPVVNDSGEEVVKEINVKHLNGLWAGPIDEACW